ncbi:MAG: tetratricopeptide repeat protein [Bacteroidota bacterium]
MPSRIHRISIFTFLFSFCAVHAQTKLKEIDKLKNDSAAIVAYEKYLHTNQLPVKQQLDVKLRITTRACRSHDFLKAISVGNEGIAVAEANNLDSLNGAFKKMLGITYYFMGESKMARDHFQKAVEVAKRSGLWFIEATCYNNLGAIHIDKKEYAEAERSLITSIQIMQQHHMEEHESVSITYRLLATNYYELKQPEKAEPIYRHLIENARMKNDTSAICGELIYYSVLLAERGETDKALEMSAEALRYLRHTHVISDLVSGLSRHAKNLIAVGRYKEAIDLNNEIYTLQRKTFLADHQKQISEVEVKYKTQQIQKEKEAAEENIKKQKWIYILSFSGLMLIAIFVVYIFNQRKNTRQKITSQKQRLEAVIEGEEKERSRVAKDLHDGIVQDLTAIKLKVENSEKNDPFLAEISHEIDKATREVRNIAYQMMPATLREYGLMPSLEDLLHKSLSPKHIKYDFETVNVDQRLPEKIEVCLYRITQELLNNVIKHSKASFVSLVISKHQDSVSLIFEDNGTGFNQQEVKKGIGMNSLSSRLEIVNGELKFETSAGTGTMAIIKIPLHFQ